MPQTVRPGPDGQYVRLIRAVIYENDHLVGVGTPLDSEVPLSRSTRLGVLSQRSQRSVSSPGPPPREPAAQAPKVRDGHIAGWVGVGGVGEGPDGTDAWIQVGLSAFRGDWTSRMYYEV